MTKLRSVIQIVPRAPGGRDGVADYACLLGSQLRRVYGIETSFVPFAPLSESPSRGFEVHPPLRSMSIRLRASSDQAVILHYVNYGYNRRGVPVWLPRAIRAIRGQGKLLTVFHELYATGSPRQSAFWLRPLQRRIARAIAAISDLALVSSDSMRDQLLGLETRTQVLVHPVPSNFGEPNLASVALTERDPHRWVICGGNELIERSLRSFLRIAPQIDPTISPRELVVIGGAEKAALRESLERAPDLRTFYHPEIDGEMASKILGGCAFGWIDYFVRPDVPLPLILKSSAFAAFCAHGVIPVMPNLGIPIRCRDDVLPGPFYVSPAEQHLPSVSERGKAARSTYDWYQRNASSAHLAQIIERALRSSE